MRFIDKRYAAWVALLLSTTTSCQQSAWTGRRAENYKLLQYRSMLDEVGSTIRLENQRLSYEIPSTFHYAYGKEIWPYSDVSQQDSLGMRHTEGSAIIPSQFSIPKIISAQEQQRAIEEEANEKLYRTQSDPSYYENAKRAFQAEYKRRRSVKGLK